MKSHNFPISTTPSAKWNILKIAFDNNKPVVGTIIEYNEEYQYYVVDIDGISARLKRYEVTYGYIEDALFFIGKKLLFNILWIDEDNERIAVSRKTYADKLKSGDTTRGIVSFAEGKRVFVDVGFTVRCVFPESYIGDLKKKFPIGKPVDVVLLEDYEHARYTKGSTSSYSIWAANTKKLSIDDILSLEVVAFSPKGLFVSVNDNFETLVETKSLTDDYRTRFEHKEIEIGEYVNVAVTSIDNEEKELCLSMKRAAQIPRERAINALKDAIEIGHILEGNVISVTRNHANVLITGTDVVVEINREHLSKDKVIDARSEVYPGQIIDIVYMGEEGGKLIFSRKVLTTSIYPKELYDLSLNEILVRQGIDTNLFIGRAVIMGNDVFFHDVASVGKDFDGMSFFEGKLLQDFITARPSIVLVKNHNMALELIENKYYQFSISLAPRQIRETQGTPFIYQSSTNSTIIPFDNPYKKEVERVFSKQESPEQSKIIASLLKEVGSQLYSGKSRMLFELLQNADDAAPSRDQDNDVSIPTVHVSIDIEENGILFKHNGCAFNFDDFKSITSAANSTKGVKKKSTGYKGIGFKSVFTNSESVFIISQGFRFRFDRNDSIFDQNQFDSLYRKIKAFSSQQDEINFFAKYAEQRRAYTGIDDVPWQIMPFWLEDLNDVPLVPKHFENVVVGLVMDAISRGEYQDAIKEVFDNPRMFLFLRHTRRLQLNSFKSEVAQTIQKDYDSNRQLITLRHSDDDANPEIYKLYNASDIVISDDAFEQAGVGIKIKCEISNGIPKYSFVELLDGMEGKKVNGIPDKIASADYTNISIAFNISDEGGIVPTNSHKSQSSFYAYLPMNEKRFVFPFYINADFVLSSSREELQADNKWNIFLFHQLPKVIINAIVSNANLTNPRYLELFPDYLETGSTATNLIASSFNECYKEIIGKERFILDDSNILRSQEEIVLDDTGLSKIIGNKLFLELISSVKHLPHPDIVVKPLSKSPFEEIETIDINILESFLTDITDESILNVWLNNIDTDSNSVELFYDWLIKHIDTLDVQKIVNALRFIPVNGSMYSLNTLNDTDFALFSDEVVEVFDLLDKIGVLGTSYKLSSHKLNQFIPLTSNQDVFNNILSKDLTVLSYPERLRLFRSMEKWDQIGDVRLKSIPIFKSALGSLISFDDAYIVPSQKIGCELPDWYNQHIMSREELCLDIAKYLPDNIKECFDKSFKLLINDKFATYIDFYNFFKNEALWSDSNTISIIDIEGCTSDTLFLAEIGQSPAKTKFIDKLDTLNLSSEMEYSRDSFEYRVILLALGDSLAAELRQKTSIDDIPLAQYALSDSVTFNVSGTIYELSLSEILPDFSTENSLGKVKNRFSDIPNINDLFVQIEIEKTQLRAKFKKFLTDGNHILTWAQISYVALEKLSDVNWASYRNYMRMPEGKEVILVFNSFVEKGWDKLLTTFLSMTYSSVSDVKGKYFESDPYTLPAERVPSYIAEWISAESTREKRTSLLIELGAFSSTCNEIKRRRKFLGETSIDADFTIKGSAVNTFCDWIIQSQQLPISNEVQKGIINTLANNAPNIINKEFDLVRLKDAKEFDEDYYKQWRQTSAISINLVDGEIPRLYKYKDNMLYSFEDGTVDYLSSTKAVYVSNKSELQTEMTAMARQPGVPFTMDNWRELFSVNRSELQKAQAEITRLREQLSTPAKRLQQGDIDEASQKELNRDARLRAKEYLISKGYDCASWDIDETSDGLYHTSKDGDDIIFAVASCRSGLVYLHTYKFAILMENPNNLLLVDDGKIVQSLSFEDAFKSNSNVNLIFDVDYIIPSSMAKIANMMQAFQKTRFVFEKPGYSLSDEIRTFGLNEKHEGAAPIIDSMDELD